MALVNYTTDSGIAVLELNNPPVNAYNLDYLRELDEAILKARFDDDVHVLVVRGAGERFFCAGADIGMLSSKSNQYRYNFSLYGHETLCKLENTPKLVIAALNGHAVGGGLEIAMSCDIRIAKKEGGQLGLAEINLGVIPGMGGTQRLPRLIGRARALELAVTGRLIPFEEAQEIGLVHHIYASEGFFDEVLAYAGQFVPPRKASFAVGRIKRAIQSGIEGSLAEGLALEREALLEVFQTGDSSEGLAAYTGKRIAQFKGV